MTPAHEFNFCLLMQPKSVQHGSRAKLIGPWNRKRILYYTDAEKEAYIQRIQEEASVITKPDFLPWKGPISIGFHFYFEAPKRIPQHLLVTDLPATDLNIGDWDNLCKGTQDGISRAGFWINDGQIWRCHDAARWWSSYDMPPRIGVELKLYELPSYGVSEAKLSSKDAFNKLIKINS